MRPRRVRPTLAMLRSVHDQNVTLVQERQELQRQNESLRCALGEEASRASALHTERRIAEERLAEVQTHLSDLRTVLGLSDPRAIDTVRFLRTELAAKLRRPA